MFDDNKTAVPVLPYEAWVSTLLTQEAHRDVNVRTFPSYPVPVTKPNKEGNKRLSTKIPATILHRDVRCLVILLPIEEQSEA